MLIAILIVYLTLVLACYWSISVLSDSGVKPWPQNRLARLLVSASWPIGLLCLLLFAAWSFCTNPDNE